VINSQTVARLRSAVFVNPVRARTETEAIDELLASLRNQPDATTVSVKITPAAHCG